MTAEEVLRAEFAAEDGSFLLQLRTDLTWDTAAFDRLTTAMLEVLRTTEYADQIPRWVAEGFWLLDTFVRDWSSHPDFPRPLPVEYYSAAYARLHDLAQWLFVGESPYQETRVDDDA